MAEALSTIAGTKNRRTYFRGTASPQRAARFTRKQLTWRIPIFL